MARTRFIAPALFALAAVLLSGCVSGMPSRDYTESDFADKVTLLYDVGASIPADGDIIGDAEARLGMGISAAYMFNGYIGGQGLVSFMSSVEEEENAIIGGTFGDFRQDTRVYGFSAGPRLALPIVLDEDLGGSGPVVEPYIDGGIGVYLTQIIAKFPRGDGGQKNEDWTEDLGMSGGGGVVFHIGENIFIGASVRAHVVFFRFNSEERFLDGNAADERIADAVFFDQEGGRADNHIWIVAGATAGLRF